jgi:hypothetical protein
VPWRWPAWWACCSAAAPCRDGSRARWSSGTRSRDACCHGARRGSAGQCGTPSRALGKARLWRRSSRLRSHCPGRPGCRSCWRRGGAGLGASTELSRVLGTFGPTLAALLVTAVSSGRRGLRALPARLRGLRALPARLRGLRALPARLTIWRVSAGWYTFALLWPAAHSLAITGVHVLLRADLPDFAHPPVLRLYPAPPELFAAGPGRCCRSCSSRACSSAARWARSLAGAASPCRARRRCKPETTGTTRPDTPWLKGSQHRDLPLHPSQFGAAFLGTKGTPPGGGAVMVRPQRRHRKHANCVDAGAAVDRCNSMQPGCRRPRQPAAGGCPLSSRPVGREPRQ